MEATIILTELAVKTVGQLFYKSFRFNRCSFQPRIAYGQCIIQKTQDSIQ
jgi:hypothetical protein